KGRGKPKGGYPPAQTQHDQRKYVPKALALEHGFHKAVQQQPPTQADQQPAQGGNGPQKPGFFPPGGPQTEGIDTEGKQQGPEGEAVDHRLVQGGSKIQGKTQDQQDQG